MAEFIYLRGKVPNNHVLVSNSAFRKNRQNITNRETETVSFSLFFCIHTKNINCMFYYPMIQWSTLIIYSHSAVAKSNHLSLECHWISRWSLTLLDLFCWLPVNNRECIKCRAEAVGFFWCWCWFFVCLFCSTPPLPSFLISLQPAKLKLQMSSPWRQ